MSSMSSAMTTRKRLGIADVLLSLAALAGLLVLGLPDAVTAQTTHWVHPLATGPAPGTGCGTDAGYTTIGAAIAAAAPGDTIMVCTGVYPENVNLNTHDLTLLGAQFGVAAGPDAVPAGRGVGESVIQGTVSTGFSITGATVDGFTVQSTTNGFNLRGTGHTIENNIIRRTPPAGGRGINAIRIGDYRLAHNNIVGYGTGMLLDGNPTEGPADVIENYVSGATSAAINVQSSAPNGIEFTDNTLEASAFGLFVTQGGHLISGNTIRAMTPGPALGIGIATNRVNDLEITGNELLGSGHGINISMFGGPWTATGNEAHQNNIAGNTVGAQINAPDVVFHATCNWWGSPTGPNHPDNLTGTGNPVVEENGTIEYNPWLILPAPSECPGAVVPPPHKVTGGGRIETEDDPGALDVVLELAEVLIDDGAGLASVGGKATFGLSVKSGSATGNLQYNDHDADIRIKATAITSVVVIEPSPHCPTGQRAQITGTADQNGTEVDFTVNVDDCGEPNSPPPDRFQIQTSAGYMAEGPLVGGNIKIKQE